MGVITVKGEYRKGTLFIYGTPIGLSVTNKLTGVYQGYFLISRQNTKWNILDFIPI